MAIKDVTYVKMNNVNYRCNYERFDSLRDFMDTQKKRDKVLRCGNHRGICSDPDWCGGVNSYDEALELLGSGYEAATEKAKKMLKSTIEGEGKRITFKNDVVGYAPVVPLALQGVPQSMINSTMKAIKAKVVDIYYNINSLASVTSDEIINIGCKVLSAIVQLEKEGYRVNLYTMQAQSINSACDMFTIKLKDSKQPIDLRRIAFPFMHAAFYRVLGFDWYTRVPDGTYMSGYGSPLYISLDKDGANKVARAAVKNDKAVIIYLREIYEKSYNVEDIIKEIKNESGNQGRQRK